MSEDALTECNALEETVLAADPLVLMTTTDSLMEDVDQSGMRIEAFLEMF